MADDEAARYRRAGEAALEQLDWCIAYLQQIGKPRISRQLAKSRTNIRRSLTHTARELQRPPPR
jgi:hypothetical protein